MWWICRLQTSKNQAMATPLTCLRHERISSILKHEFIPSAQIATARHRLSAPYAGAPCTAPRIVRRRTGRRIRSSVCGLCPPSTAKLRNTSPSCWSSRANTNSTGLVFNSLHFDSQLLTRNIAKCNCCIFCVNALLIIWRDYCKRLIILVVSVDLHVCMCVR